jgi:hypothetical protein
MLALRYLRKRFPSLAKSSLATLESHSDIRRVDCSLVILNVVSPPPYGLPQELLDAIIDCLCGDSLSLRACSLVSKAWTKRAQILLFRTVAPTNRASVTTLMRVLDRSTHIAPGVRCLILRFPGVFEYTPLGPDYWLEYAYRELGSRLRGVTYLCIGNWCYWHDKSPIETFFIAGFPGITHLVIHTTHFGSAQGLVQALKLRPSLARLEMNNLSAKEPQVIDVPFSLTALRTFDFVFGAGRGFLNENTNAIPRNLALGNGVFHLRAVRLSNIYDERVPDTLDLLRAVCSSLRYLSIGIASLRAAIHLACADPLYCFL